METKTLELLKAVKDLYSSPMTEQQQVKLQSIQNGAFALAVQDGISYTNKNDVLSLMVEGMELQVSAAYIKKYLGITEIPQGNTKAQFPAQTKYDNIADMDTKLNRLLTDLSRFYVNTINSKSSENRIVADIIREQEESKRSLEKIEVLETENQTLKEEIQALKKEIDVLKKNNTELNNECSVLNDQLKALQIVSREEKDVLSAESDKMKMFVTGLTSKDNETELTSKDSEITAAQEEQKPVVKSAGAAKSKDRVIGIPKITPESEQKTKKEPAADSNAVSEPMLIPHLDPESESPVFENNSESPSFENIPGVLPIPPAEPKEKEAEEAEEEYGIFPYKDDIYELSKQEFVFAYSQVVLMDEEEQEIDGVEIITVPLSTKEKYPEVLVWISHEDKTETHIVRNKQVLDLGTFKVELRGVMKGKEFRVYINMYGDTSKKINVNTHNNGFKGHLYLDADPYKIHVSPITFKNDETGFASFVYCVEKDGQIIASGDNSNGIVKLEDGRNVVARWINNQMYGMVSD